MLKCLFQLNSFWVDIDSLQIKQPDIPLLQRKKLTFVHVSIFCIKFFLFVKWDFGKAKQNMFKNQHLSE